MVDRMTKEERVISMAIEKDRETKALLQQESVHERVPTTETIPEVEKIKRPKAEKDKSNPSFLKESYDFLRGIIFSFELRFQWNPSNFTVTRMSSTRMSSFT